MKHIAIFCDGTWNRHDARYPTNVLRLAQALAPHDAAGAPQITLYVPGVGTGQGSTAPARMMDRVLGGGLGLGLTEQLEDTFRQLMFLYDPGDRLHVFGFSRGAYMARSLTGLIRSTGIPPRTNTHRLPYAIRRYRQRTPGGADKDGPWPRLHPGSDDSHAFRADLSPGIATSETEADWRMALGLPRPLVLSIDYLGVFDTVGALGVPGHVLAAPILNRGVRFHDTALTSMVLSARHALALDERRRAFAPTLWKNTDNLNCAALGLPDAALLPSVPVAHLPFREEWFAGDHGSVGGGGVIGGLSAICALWIAEGARGLRFDPCALERIVRGVDGRARLNNHILTGPLTAAMRRMGADRDGPSDIGAVSDAARERVLGDVRYRPGSLRRVLAQLTG